MSTEEQQQGASAPAHKNAPRKRHPWWRAYDGLPTCARWRVVARRARRPYVEVLGVVLCLLNGASVAKERGDIKDFNAETCAVGLDIETADVEAIVAALEATGWLAGGRIATWNDRQVAEEDSTAAERQANKRARDKAAQGQAVTASHGAVTADHDRGEEDENIAEQNQNISCAAHHKKSDYAEEDWPSQRHWAHDDTDESDEVSEAFSNAASAMMRNRTPATILDFQEARNRQWRGRWPPGQPERPPIRWYDVRTGAPIAA